MTEKVKRRQNQEEGPPAKTKKFFPSLTKPKLDNGKPFPTKGKQWNQNNKQKFNKKDKPDPDANYPQGDQNWNDFKKQKKELKLKRKKARGLYEISIEAKKIFESLRKKELKGGKTERKQLVSKLHDLVKGSYEKVVLSHDLARIIQFLLKFAPEATRKEVAKEIIPISVVMVQSKYARYCFKSLLKHGNDDIRTEAINMFYGKAVKLVSNVVSAPFFEFAYTNYATPVQKQNLIQEFFGDLYKVSKDSKVKHLSDVYKDSSNMKVAALSATKANLSRALNKNLLDSGLIQSVLSQFLSECNEADRGEIISQLASHIVILSNSKDGVRVAMQCIWHGNNKDKKMIVKALKEHLLELSKHEHGHATVITLLDSVDDTVLLKKIIIEQLVENVKDLIVNEWGRKVILWLVAPANQKYFHPTFIKELKAGYDTSTSKKSPELRRSEMLSFARPALYQAIASEPHFWLSTSSIAVVTLSVFKSGVEDAQEALDAICNLIVFPGWKIKEDEKEIDGIEHPGLHMILKKFAHLDKQQNLKFGKLILDLLTDEIIKTWLKLNRGCFFLVVIFENSTEEVQQQMKGLFSSHLKMLKKQTGSGAQILLKKLS